MTDSTLINLSKQVDIVLMKRSAPKIVAQVGMALDVSGSAEPLFTGGVMQSTVKRIFALAFKFDDNKVLDAWTFGSDAQAVTPVEESMFDNYVQKHILGDNKVKKWTGTNYAPALRLINEHYKPTVAAATVAAAKGFFGKVFGKKEEAPAPAAPGIPAYNIIVTDGENNDKSATESEFERTKDANVYYQFVGIGGHQQFQFMERMANQYDNVGFFNANQIQNMSDADLYEKLLNPEFITWYKKQTGKA